MKKTLLVFFFFLSTVGLYAQNNCPLNIRVSTEDGTCYNNCMINIALVDGDNNPLDVSTTDLSDIKYFRIDMNTGDTAYSTTNSFMVSVGTYKVGVEAVCYHSTSSDSMYIRVSKDTLVSTRTSYVTPVLSMISNVAGSNTGFGTIHSLSCQNTGRVQFNITGGSFPYFIEIRDESGTPIDTVVFSERQYNGNRKTRYDYKDYYSIDGLAPGKYKFYVWDGCEYHLPMVWQEILTEKLPHVRDICVYSSSYPYSIDAVVYGMNIAVGGNRTYYLDSLWEVSEYRFIYPEINGVRDTTPWKHFKQNQYYNGSFRLYDTVYQANSFCDLYDKSITFQARNTKCEEFPITQSYRFYKIRDNMLHVWSTIATDSTVTFPEQYDSCGVYALKTIEYGGPSYVLSVDNYSNYCGTDEPYAYHHMQPVYCVYTDTSTHNIIKIDSSFSNGGSIKGCRSYLTPNDIIPLYGSLEDTSITIPVQRTVIDNSGCELYSRFDNLTFEKKIVSRGGEYERLSFSTSNSTTSTSECCSSSTREVRLYSNHAPPMNFLGNVVVRLIVSPENNKYNFTATYDQSSQQWTIVKDSTSNLARISNNGFNFYITDYCLPTGTYTFSMLGSIKKLLETMTETGCRR